MGSAGRRRVAYLCEFPTLLGGERSLLAFLHAAGARVRPTVVAPAAGPLADALAASGIDHLPWPGGAKKASGALADALHDRRVELVHGNSLMTVDVVHRLQGRTGLPGVLHVRDVMKLSEARRRRLGEMAAVVAVSQATADRLTGQGVSAANLHVVPNGVAAADGQASRPSAADRGPGRAELGLPSDRVTAGRVTAGQDLPYGYGEPAAAADRVASEPMADDRPAPVACVGQFALRKGQDLFLQAAARIAVEVPEARFLVVGQRYSGKAETVEYERELHRLADVPELAGRVRFAGYRDDVPELLGRCAVLVVPSRQEPFSRATLEAMAAGTAVVATRVGGAGELLDGGRCGVLVPPDDADALAAAVVRLLRDSAERGRLAEAARRRVRRRFLAAVQVASMLALYGRVLTRPMPGGTATS